MHPSIYNRLTSDINANEVLADIAFAVYSMVTARTHLYPDFLARIRKYPSFEQMMRQADSLEADDEAQFLADFADIIDQELDNVFDAAEDSVKQFYTEGAGGQMLMRQMIEENPLLTPHKLTEDEVELYFIADFRRLDRYKDSLRKRIYSLAPAKAFAQGAQIWKEERNKRGILMDDDDLVREFQSDMDLQWIHSVLCTAFYRGVQFGRHYEPVSEENDEFDPDDEDDSEIDPSLLEPGSSDLEAFQLAEDEKEPDYLQEDGDLRDQIFDYVGDIWEEYTGSREFPAEDENGADSGEAHWTVYGEVFNSTVYEWVLTTLSITLNRLNDSQPSLLKNLADQHGIDKEHLTDPISYWQDSLEFRDYLFDLTDMILDDFADMSAADAMEIGKEMQDRLDRQQTQPDDQDPDLL